MYKMISTEDGSCYRDNVYIPQALKACFIMAVVQYCGFAILGVLDPEWHDTVMRFIMSIGFISFLDLLVGQFKGFTRHFWVILFLIFLCDFSSKDGDVYWSIHYKEAYVFFISGLYFITAQIYGYLVYELIFVFELFPNMDYYTGGHFNRYMDRFRIDNVSLDNMLPSIVSSFTYGIVKVSAKSDND